MKAIARSLAVLFLAGIGLAPGAAWAFVSGSTGADGDFSPTVSTTVTLPASGIFNYGTVNIPAGVTVTFLKNTTNTPVVILATGNVTVAGSIDVRGASGAAVGASGDGAIGDDGAPGKGGPGGFDGGRGGLTGANRAGGGGLGPGGGAGGFVDLTNPGNPGTLGGGGGGYSTAGAASGAWFVTAAGGDPYGSSQILPLIGGSGGGGGTAGTTLVGTGGGGGGGALLIAASGTVSITGSILANGGAGASVAGGTGTATGGGGSGGAIRIIATAINGNGTVSAVGGAAGTGASGTGATNGGAGAAGRIRLEYETTNRTAVSNPPHTTQLAGTAPGPVFIAGGPTLRITTVAGVAAPAAPTGNADITLPSSTPNPVTVAFETTGVPVGNTVRLTVTPAYGTRTSAISPALSGSTASATASVNVNLPVGPSVLAAQTTFTVVAAIGDLLRNFAGNERVEKVTLLATFGGPTRAKLITVSGKEYEVPAEVLRIAALGG